MNTEYILESSKSAKSNSREKHIYGDKLVFVKDVLPYGFNLDYVIETIENIVPRAFVENVDAIYIGKFNDFNKDNDPYGEHDFGSIKINQPVNEGNYYFKIDYYQNKDMDFGAENHLLGSCYRAITIMHSSEY